MFARSIKSYVVRNGRLSKGQKKLLEAHLPSYKLSVDSLLKSKNNFLKNCNLEVGFGRGDVLVHMAKNNPDKNFIGLETYLNGISITLRKSIENSLSNIKVVHSDVLLFLESLRHKVLFENIFFFFPDPWPKKKHNKRRLINLKNLNYFYDFLSHNGNIYIITDHQEYIESINLFSEKLQKKYKLSNILPNILSNRPHTKYEEKAIKNNSKISEIIFKKIT
jgi:tRNA (guanine-N7-)-methyltransferase